MHQISLDLNGGDSQPHDWNSGLPQVPDLHYEFHQFLEMIANPRPGIRELCFTAGPVALDFLWHFTQLFTLRFTTVSITCSEETLAILQSLEHLDTLTVYQHPTPVIHFFHPARRLKWPPAVTPEVVAQMNSLRVVEFICETKKTIGSMVLFKKMINALHAHADTLESFAARISSRTKCGSGVRRTAASCNEAEGIGVVLSNKPPDEERGIEYPRYG